MRALALFLLLAACARDVAPPAPVSFRQAGSPIASTTRGGPADLAGEWVISDAYPGGPIGGYATPGAALLIAAGPDGAGSWTFDPPGEGWVVLNSDPVGPGRFALAAAGSPQVWVLWVDDDFRTAAVGTPDGSLGWIMDRPGEASPDRTEAARRMLEFNGYDLARLVGP